MPKETKKPDTYSFPCAECGRTATDNAPGWKGFRTDLEDEPPALAFYCPRCAQREFGDR